MAQERTDDPIASAAAGVPADPVVAAIEKVLAAERAAEATLADCRLEAQATIAAARERAEVIGRRTDARISRVHTAYLQKVEGRTATLRRPSLPADDAADERERHSLYAEAARRLAAKLTSDGGEATR